MQPQTQTLPAQYQVNTSAVAFEALGNVGRQSMHTKILDICIGAQKHGVKDLTASEIVDRYHTLHGKRVKDGSMAGRISELVAASKLEKLPARICTSSGALARPVCVPMAQARLVA
jgi:hypothetical protein